MIRYFCDRCNKEMSPYKSLRLSYKSVYIERKAVVPVTHEYLLCDTCASEFFTWIAPEKEMEK